MRLKSGVPGMEYISCNCGRKLSLSIRNRRLSVFLIFANFVPDTLFHLPKRDRLVHVPFGLQVSPEKAVGRSEVRRLGWPCVFTKNVK